MENFPEKFSYRTICGYMLTTMYAVKNRDNICYPLFNHRGAGYEITPTEYPLRLFYLRYYTKFYN
jgi:hypothetical protein